MIAFRCYKLPPSKESDLSRYYVIGMGNYASIPSYAIYNYTEQRMYSSIDDELRAGTLTQEDTATLEVGNMLRNYSHILYNCTQYNSPLNIPNEIINLNYAFWNCRNFNQPLNLKDVKNRSIYVSHMLENAHKFNQNITIYPNYVVRNSLFAECHSLNANVYVANGTPYSSYEANEEKYYKFMYNCYNQELPFNIVYPSTGSRNYAYAFANCYNLGKRNNWARLEYRIQCNDEWYRNTSIAHMFENCKSLQDVMINFNRTKDESNVYVDCNGAFMGCSNFNGSVTVYSPVSLAYMFKDCTNITHRPIQLMDMENSGYSSYGVNCAYMFQNCINYNDNFIINFPNNGILISYGLNFSHMYENCYNFRSGYVSIGDSVYSVALPNSANSYNCSYMFANSNITSAYLGNGIYNAAYMFYGVKNFHFLSNIPNSIGNLSHAFDGTRVRNLIFNIDGWTLGSGFNTVGMLANKNRNFMTNLFFPKGATNNYFKVTNANSIIGAPITWTDMTNGFYNAEYNIYCYDNYTW